MKDNYTRKCLYSPGPFIIGCPNMNRKGGLRGWGRVFGQGHCARALGKDTGQWHWGKALGQELWEGFGLPILKSPCPYLF